MAIRSAFSPFGGQHEPYDKGELLQTIDMKNVNTTNNTVVRTKEFDLKTTGIYALTIVGAGGSYGIFYGWDGDLYKCGPCSGSGAAYKGELKLLKGHYRLTVGRFFNGNQQNGEDSKLEIQNADGSWKVLVSAGGGIYATGDPQWASPPGGAGGTLTIISEVQIGNFTIRTNGNKGANGTFYWYNGVTAGAASVCEGYGIGGGSPFGNGGANSPTGGVGILSYLRKRL